MIKLVKNLYYKINCYCGRHVWKDLNKPINHAYPYRYSYRACTHCGKQQYRETSPYKQIAEQKPIVWEDSSTDFKTDTQIACEKTKDLLSRTKFLYNELAKFDSCVEEKTKTFMHLVNLTKSLSTDYMNLKEDIRNLHIKKQKESFHTENDPQ